MIKEDMSKYVVPILIWVVGASIGFGGSQLLFVTPIKEQMREHSVRVKALERNVELNGRTRSHARRFHAPAHDAGGRAG